MEGDNIKTNLGILFFFIATVLYGNNTLFLDKNTNNLNITKNLKIYIDDTKSKSFEEILKLDSEFKTFGKYSFDFGYIVDKAVWGQITFQNNTNKDIQKILEYDDPLVSQYFLYKDGKKLARLQGVKYRESTVKNLHNFFYITIPKNSVQTYYIYLTTDYSATHGKFTLIDEDEFFEKETSHFLILTVFFTAMSVLILYNTFLYIFSRDKIYLAYVLFIVNTIFMQSIATAYLYTFIEPSTREYFENDIFSMMVINLIFACSIFFIKQFLDIKQYPKINLSLNILLVLIIVAIPLLSIPSLFYLFEFNIDFCYVTGLYLWGIGFYSITKKNRFGIYYSFGFGLNIFALVVSTSHYLGLYPFLYKFPYITEGLYLMEGFLFSFILAQRFKTLEKEKNNLNQQLLKQQQNENIRLEKEVNEKTLHLNNSLKLKKELLKELNHRVKNNMQIIISLIRFQYRQLKNNELKETLKDIENKIHILAKVHELLYYENDIVDSDSKRYYLETLLDTIQNLFEDDYDVEFEVFCECSFDMNYSMYIGLIINELIFNCFKYAFIDKKGVINIVLKKEGDTHILIVEDDGIGFLNQKRDESLGLILVQTLVEDKLEGEIDIVSSANGTKVTIRF